MIGDYNMAKNILICDDAAFMRMMIKDILTKNGYTVVGEAENGLKAVEKYAETKPDLVMMDITMPEMDGIQALKKIKSTDPSANIIMCSAMGQQAMVIESIQSGAKDFIVKPFQADRVLEAVKKAVG
jgi:Response regulator containing CheY-like receiver, AAA-type ATPase, and DNA-binding domains